MLEKTLIMPGSSLRMETRNPFDMERFNRNCQWFPLMRAVLQPNNGVYQLIKSTYTRKPRDGSCYICLKWHIEVHSKSHYRVN